jgi:NTE family protein
MHYFDSREMTLTMCHVLASAALPPAFPPVWIDNEYYWDGGILSNTPIEAIFDDVPRRDSIVFAVNVWDAVGPEPNTIWEVLHRHKDFNIQAALQTILPASSKSTACVMSSPSSSTACQRTSGAPRGCAIWPATAA